MRCPNDGSQVLRILNPIEKNEESCLGFVCARRVEEFAKVSVGPCRQHGDNALVIATIGKAIKADTLTDIEGDGILTSQLEDLVKVRTMRPFRR